MAANASLRVLLKVSGEGFCKPGGSGMDPDEVRTVARQIGEVAGTGCELAVVVGGGNFLRGAGFSQEANVNRATADYMGMIATVINGLALQDCLEGLGVDTRVQSAMHPPPRKETRRHPRRRNREPLLHHRHHGRSPRQRDPGRGPPQGHQGRRRLLRRPQRQPRRHALRPPHLQRRHAAGPEDHRPCGYQPLPRSPSSSSISNAKETSARSLRVNPSEPVLETRYRAC